MSRERMNSMTKEQFVATKAPIRYFQGKSVYLFDQVIIPSECRLIIRFESTESEWRQGVRLGDMTTRATKMELTVNNQIASGILLWTDTCPPEVEIALKSPSQTLFLYNIWDTGDGRIQSQTSNAGMLIENQSEGVIRYYCNDGHTNETYSHLVFSLKMLEPN
jgi:hypothetical protein